jgi:DnaJ-class molecular chaperone
VGRYGWGRCDKCGGSGQTDRADAKSQCAACRGSGEVDDSARDGVSVFADEHLLYRYMLRGDADIAGAVLVELEGDPSADEDFDADEGALLVHPRRIVDVREPNRGRLARLRDD